MRITGDLILDAGDPIVAVTHLEELWLRSGRAAALDDPAALRRAAALLDRAAYRSERAAHRLRALARHPEPTQEGPTP